MLYRSTFNYYHCFISFSLSLFFGFFTLIPTSYLVPKVTFMYCKMIFNSTASNHGSPRIAVANCEKWYIIFRLSKSPLKIFFFLVGMPSSLGRFATSLKVDL